MTILVTGGLGYIGSHMVFELLERGEEIVVIDDISTGTLNAIPSTVPVVVCDFGSLSALDHLLSRQEIETIFHFAAKIAVSDSVSRPAYYYDENFTKSCQLIQRAILHGVKHFIFSSTAAVYGFPAVEKVTESSTCAPISPYGRSKLMVEWFLEDVAKVHDLSFAALRYFNVAGADPARRTGPRNSKSAHLLKVAVDAALGRRAGLEVFGTDYPTRDGSGVRDYIHVTDLVSAHFRALEWLRRNNRKSITCNVGYGRGHSVFEMIEAVQEVSGSVFPVTAAPRRPGDVASIVADSELARRELSWLPKYNDLRSIVKSTLDWEVLLNKVGP